MSYDLQFDLQDLIIDDLIHNVKNWLNFLFPIFKFIYTAIYAFGIIVFCHAFYHFIKEHIEKKNDKMYMENELDTTETTETIENKKNIDAELQRTTNIYRNFITMYKNIPPKMEQN